MDQTPVTSDWHTWALIAGGAITVLAGIVVSMIAAFLKMIHSDLRALNAKLEKLLRELPLDYVRKADYSDDQRHHREGVVHIHERITAVRTGQPEPIRAIRP